MQPCLQLKFIYIKKIITSNTELLDWWIGKNSLKPTQKLIVQSYSNIQPKIILSLSHAYLTVPLEAPLVSPDGGPIAMRTRLGWVIYGPVQGGKVQQPARAMHIRFSKYSTLYLAKINKMLKIYFDMEP